MLVCIQLTIAYWRAGIPLSRAIAGECVDVVSSESTITRVNSAAFVGGRVVHPRAVIRDGWITTI